MILPAIRGFYTFNAFFSFAWGIFAPICMLYPLRRGFDMTDLAMVISVLFLVQLAAEIPTGIVADRFSRRGSIAIGQGLNALAMVLIVLADTFALLTCAFVLLGLGSAFNSGSMSALVYDALKVEGQDESFQHIFGTGQSIGIVSQVIGSATCGLVSSQFGMVPVLWISAASYVLGGLIARAIPEPSFLVDERRQHADTTFVRTVVDYGRHLSGSVRIVHGNTSLRVLFAMQAIFLVPLAIIQHYYTQPYLATFDYSAAQISYVYTFILLVQAVLSKYSATIRAALGTERRTYVAIAALVLFAIVSLVHAPTGLVVIVALVATRTSMGLAMPTLQESLNRRLDSGQRASCLSLAAMGQSLLMALCLPFFGHIADAWSLWTSLWVLEGVFVPLLVVTWVAGRWLREQPLSARAIETST